MMIKTITSFWNLGPVSIYMYICSLYIANFFEQNFMKHTEVNNSDNQKRAATIS